MINLILNVNFCNSSPLINQTVAFTVTRCHTVTVYSTQPKFRTFMGITYVVSWNNFYSSYKFYVDGCNCLWLVFLWEMPNTDFGNPSTHLHNRGLKRRVLNPLSLSHCLACLSHSYSLLFLTPSSKIIFLIQSFNKTIVLLNYKHLSPKKKKHNAVKNAIAKNTCNHTNRQRKDIHV